MVEKTNFHIGAGGGPAASPARSDRAEVNCGPYIHRPKAEAVRRKLEARPTEGGGAGVVRGPHPTLEDTLLGRVGRFGLAMILAFFALPSSLLLARAERGGEMERGGLLLPSSVASTSSSSPKVVVGPHPTLLDALLAALTRGRPGLGRHRPPRSRSFSSLPSADLSFSPPTAASSSSISSSIALLSQYPTNFPHPIPLNFSISTSPLPSRNAFRLSAVCLYNALQPSANLA
mmetsp:Transcript_6167/g.10528  ORF Transcript_6167/g.10528 Transcript_6167/m.10528 type:complete len:232 (+) Transcript_6167:804-1499(+)